MASEKNEIGDIVKKCKILLLDIEGTTTSISFVKDKLFPYADANVKEFLESQWENEDVKEAVAALKKLAVEDQEKNVEGAVAIPGEDAGKEDQIEGLVKSVQWLMAADRKAGPLKQLQGLIWKQGYDKGDIKGHVYDDVPPALELWRSIEGQKVYIYSSGSVQAQKLLFKMSVAGDLLPHIEGHFDTAIGAKQEATSYTAIAEKIGSKPEEILFLTDIVKEAEAARASGLEAALVSREGNAPLPDESTSSYPVLHSFEQLTVSNKRKPDPQEDEVPAKVPKTDLEDDVKTGPEMEANNTAPTSEMVTSSESKETVSKVADEPEKMEVEEEVTVAEISTVTEKVEEMSLPSKTTIVEVTNPKEAGDKPVSGIGPVIEESVEKTEKMEIEDEEPVGNAKEPKESAQEKIDEKSAPVAENTPPSVITIQDVTEEMQSVSEGTEVVDDLVPVVEEPPNAEMEELKNVGDVLEKECDEILSKVQDVTNLDNIPIKPLLNSIAEVPIESENGENTNDIVESILDSEMELSKKPCDDIDVNTVQEIVDTKPDVLEEKEVKANAEKPSVQAEQKTIESIVDKNTVENTEENKIKGTTDDYTKDQDETKMDENDSTETEVTNRDTHNSKSELDEKMDMTDSINEPKCDTPEVTNGDMHNNKSEPDKKMETTDSISKPKCDSTLEEKKYKPISDASVETKTPMDPDNKMETKESAPVQVDNKMESEEDTATSVASKLEIKKSIAEAVETKAEGTISEPVDSTMESSDSTADPLKDQKQSEDIAVKSVDNKTEIKRGTVETKDTKIESKVEAGNDNKSGAVDNKNESNDNKDGSKGNKSVSNKSGSNDIEVEGVNTKSEAVDTKSDAANTQSQAVDTKSEPVDTKSDAVDTKGQAVDTKSEAVDTKSEAVDTKSETVDTKSETVDTKSGADDTKSGADDIKGEAVDTKSEAVETKSSAVETKSGPGDKKSETGDSKSESGDNKSGAVDNKRGAVDTKSETVDTKSEAVDAKGDSVDIKSGSSDTKSGSDGTKRGSDDDEMEDDNSKVESEHNKSVDTKMESEDSMSQESKTDKSIAEPSIPITTEKVTESKDSASKDVQMEIEVTETRMNGKTNGEPNVTSNGDASKEEELNARLSIENGDNGMEVNGANGNGETIEDEAGQGDNKMDTGISDIKIKTVASEDPRPDPIEQPVEA